MNRFNLIKTLPLAIACTALSTAALAEMSVDKSTGVLTITSDIDGTVVAKVIGPDDVVVVDDRYEGNSFSWAPSSGPDGAYRYDIRISDQSRNESIDPSTTSVKSDYAGGSVEVKNGQIAMEGGQ